MLALDSSRRGQIRALWCSIISSTPIRCRCRWWIVPHLLVDERQRPTIPGGSLHHDTVFVRMKPRSKRALLLPYPSSFRTLPEVVVTGQQQRHQDVKTVREQQEFSHQCREALVAVPPLQLHPLQPLIANVKRSLQPHQKPRAHLVVQVRWAPAGLLGNPPAFGSPRISHSDRGTYTGCLALRHACLRWPARPSSHTTITTTTTHHRTNRFR